MKVKWHAQAYKHFQADVDVIWNSNIGQWAQEFTCKRSGVKVRRLFSNNCTSNLNNHMKSCAKQQATTEKAAAGHNGEPPLQQSSLVPFIQGSTYTSGRLRLYEVEWVVKCHQPYSMFEDGPYWNIIHMFNPSVKMPSVDMVSHDVKDVYQMVKKRVASLLQGVRGKIHIAQDGWAAPQKLSLMGLVAVWAADSKMQTLTMDMVHLHKSHTGNYLAGCFYKSLQDFGVVDKLLSVPRDNASSNTTMLQSLKAPGRLPRAHIAGTQTQVRCAGHIFDLCNKAIFRPFLTNKRRSSDDDDDDDWLDDDDDDELDEEECILTEELANDEREEQEEATLEDLLEAIENLAELEEEDGTLERNAVMKICKLGCRVFNNGLMQEDLLGKCAIANVKVQGMIQAVVTRWLMQGTVLQRALELRPTLDLLCDDSEWNPVRNRKKCIRKFKLNDNQWQFLEQLEPMLIMLALATEHKSKSKVPLIHEVIPLFDSLISKFENFITDDDLFPGVRAAAIRGCAVLCKYYAKTDDSIMYRMAMIMHPRYKLDYFQEHEWEPEWIDRCYEIVRDIWKKHYKPHAAVIVMPEKQKKGKSFHDIFPELSQKGRRDGDGDTDALEKYLSGPISEDVDDPLRYWTTLLDECDESRKVIQVTGKGALAQMALDFLSVPATSTDVERLFSHGGLNVTKHRHKLSAESTINQTVLHSWFKQPGLVPQDQLMAHFNDKSKRPNNGGRNRWQVDNSTVASSSEVITVDAD